MNHRSSPIRRTLAAVALAGAVILPASPAFAQEEATTSHIVYEILEDASQAITPEVLSMTVEAMQARLASVGDADATVSGYGDRFVIVDLVGHDEVEVAYTRDLLGPLGRVDFVAVQDGFEDRVAEGEALPEGMDATPIFSGNEIEMVEVQPGQMGEPELKLRLKATGARLLDEFAAENVGRRLAVVLDGEVIVAAVIREPAFLGTIVISGVFADEDVAKIAAILGSPALPLEMRDLASPAAE